jgi:hypothetical protein
VSEPEDVQAAVLARALEATTRSAVAAEGAASDPLHDPALVALAEEALGDALGPPRTGSELFPMTVWQHGAGHVGKRSPGVQFAGTIDTFVATLRQRAEIVAAKKTGWVVEPTTNSDGRRTNESTLFMHAVFLDCDNTGTWDATLERLSSLGLCHIAYQSSGYQPGVHKWRVVLPLASKFSVLNDLERAAWKKMYHRCRVLVGALGKLRAEGFDCRTDAPSIPWFITERRLATDLPRQVRFQPGASLDLLALAMALPVIETPEEESRPKRPVITVAAERPPMEDAEIDFLVSSLAAVTNAVPRGRRDLYMALPGAMLDRGVHPEDVLAVCTQVSLAYPRKHYDKHKDNVHGARTTIAKWAAKDPTYTRIGTLQGIFPEVAAVLDRLVPNLVDQALDESMAEGAAIHSDVEADVPDVSAPAAPSPSKKAKPNRLRVKLEKLAAEQAELVDDARRRAPAASLAPCSNRASRRSSTSASARRRSRPSSTWWATRWTR